MDVLPAAEPKEVVNQVRELQMEALKEDPEALEDLGVADAEEAQTKLRRLFDGLKTLREENRALQQLQSLVDADSPDAAANSIKELRNRVQTLEEQQQVLADAGFKRPEHAVQALASMKQQLDELYGEKEATERSAPEADFQVNGDTFDQLQALLAREEKLQRELGVSSPDAVIEIVEGLSDQLEDLYHDREADTSTESIFAPSDVPSSPASRLEEVLGTSDPDTVLEMVEGLTDQLDALYESRERLADLNLNGADEAIEMVQSMQKQLDIFHEKQAQLSEHDIDGIDHALSMIESMEAQLSALYDERDRLSEEGPEIPDEILTQLGALEEKLNALIEEKEILRDKRDRLQTQFSELETELGNGNPEAVTNIIDNLETQLEGVDAETNDSAQESAPQNQPPLPNDILVNLDDLDDDELDALSAGTFCVDDQGTIRRVNKNVLEWPDVNADSADDLLGRNFFEDVAPATKNVLFQGRFEEHADEDAMDEHFFYTYVSKRDATMNLTIHLYRKSEASHNWIVFRVL